MERNEKPRGKHRPKRPGAPINTADVHDGDDGTPIAKDLDNESPDDPNNHPQPTPNPSETPPFPPKAARSFKCHGYATVEVFPGAARVTRWEYIDEPRELTPEEVRRHQRVFCLGEWLSKQPISDEVRAEYLDIERVSLLSNEVQLTDLERGFSMKKTHYGLV